MFMPYYNNHIDITLENFKEDMDNLFSVEDRIFSVGILGGEPIINKQLPEIILYLQENYGDRIGEIFVITNGTILPDNSFNFNNVRNHMMECFPIFRGINDSKLYFCHVAWSAEKCGMYTLQEEDYFDIKKIDKFNEEQVKEFIRE